MKLVGFETSGESTDEARADGKVFGLVKRYDKKRAASGKVGHQGKLSGVYRDVIEINGGSLVAAGGYTTTFGLICGLLGVYFLRDLLYVASTKEGGYIFLIFSFFALFSIFLIGIYFEMFSPSESPIYFDRARRKVYYVHRSARRRFILFGPSAVEARVIDWSLVDAEHHTKMRASTASVSRDHYLVFLMRKSETDPTIVDSYAIAADFPSALWEYIRRYMERGAAPLIAAEAPPYKGPTFDMIEALKQRRKNYWQDWKELPWSQMWQHLALPLFAVFFVVNRFVVWTAQKVQWPQEVVEALGAPITEEDLKADATHTLRPA
ncbi:hypothetical protein D3C86_1071810 [compost metagenome]